MIRGALLAAVALGGAEVSQEGSCLLQADKSMRRAPVNLVQETASMESVSAVFADVRSAQKTAARMRDPELLETWIDGGQAATTSWQQAELDQLASSITAEAFGAELHAVAALSPSRFILSDGNMLAADYIRSEFENLGLTIWSEPLSTEGTRLAAYIHDDVSRTAGIVGRLQGTDLAHEVVLLGAHFDSVNWEGISSGDAPGVDDNGSGVAMVLQAARVLAGMQERPRRSVLFVAFNAEEEGLYGSKEIARIAETGKYGDLKSAIIADEIAWPGSGRPLDERQAIFETVGSVDGTTAMLDTFAHTVREGDGVNGFKVNKHGFSSDHISFLDNQIPTVLLIEGDNMNHADEWGHSARDTFEHVDFEFGAAMSRVALRAAATLAWPAQ